MEKKNFVFPFVVLYDSEVVSSEEFGIPMTFTMTELNQLAAISAVTRDAFCIDDFPESLVSSLQHKAWEQFHEQLDEDYGCEFADTDFWFNEIPFELQYVLDRINNLPIAEEYADFDED